MNEGIQQWGPGYGPQAAAMHTFSLAAQLSSSARRPIQTPDVGIKRNNMNTKYSAALLAVTLVSLSAHGSDILRVIFPTNLVFTVPINGKTGERPYDFFLEYPSEYELDDGRPTKYERTGLGYYICVEVIEETEDGVRCKLKVDRHSLSDWMPYTAGEHILLQPVLSSLAIETELTLPIGMWVTLAEDVESACLQFMFEREESYFQLRNATSAEGRSGPARGLKD